MKVTPVLLIVLDGFGYREECEDNAICQARKPRCDVCIVSDLCRSPEKWFHGAPPEPGAAQQQKDVQ